MSEFHPFNNSLCVFPQGFYKLDNSFQVESYSWGDIGNYENIIKYYDEGMNINRGRRIGV